jgi:hypothetical protein
MKSKSKSNNYQRRNRAPVLITRQVSLPSNLMPPTLQRTLVYEDNRVLSATAGAISAFAVKANGLYDPNSSGIGHQPNGFDQMAVFYNRYTVVSSQIEITAYPTATTTVWLVVGSMLLPSTSLPTDIQEVLEQPITTYCPFQNHNLYGRPAYLIQRCDVSEHYGTKNVVANPDFAATFTSDPTRLLTYNVFGTCADFATATGNFLVRIRASYTVVFADRINVPES